MRGAAAISSLTAALIAACADPSGPGRVVDIRVRAPRLLVVAGGSVPIESVFVARTEDGATLVGSGAARVSVEGAGWRVGSDSLYAPAAGATAATVVVAAGGVRATIAATAVPDLTRRRWHVDVFCQCVPYCFSTVATRHDSVLTVATVEALRRPRSYAFLGPGELFDQGLVTEWTGGTVRREVYRSVLGERGFVPAGLGEGSVSGAIAAGLGLRFLQTGADTLVVPAVGPGDPLALTRASPPRYERARPAPPATAACIVRPDRAALVEAL